MNAKEFLKTHDEEQVKSVAEAAGTTLGYFKQIAYGFRHPSRKLASRLAKASQNKMSASELLLSDSAA